MGHSCAPKRYLKTSFVAPKGKYEFFVMPYGLATFQRHMDNLDKQMHDEGYKGVDAYVDNKILFSKSFGEHIEALDSLVYHVDSCNMSLRSDKCEFAKLLDPHQRTLIWSKNSLLQPQG